MPTTTSEPEPGPSFEDLGLDKRVLRALSDVGYESPSPIQAATIPALLAGRHVVGLAQTGTGKTAAFAVPILSQLELRQKAPQALVLAPTRELALQVSEAFERYAAHMPGVHVLPVYGGQAYGVQLSALRRGVHVVVGTPGRSWTTWRRARSTCPSCASWSSTRPTRCSRWASRTTSRRSSRRRPRTSTALFSATMPAQIRRISKKYLKDAAEITVKNKTVTAANTTWQRYLLVAHPQQAGRAHPILEIENFEAMIVFVRTKQATEVLAERLRAWGFAAAINGDIAQAQRERTINQLRDGRLDILVATDAAARGLDVERISHVVNYDIPTDTESYVHRIGRTGRAGTHRRRGVVRDAA